MIGTLMKAGLFSGPVAEPYSPDGNRTTKGLAAGSFSLATSTTPFATVGVRTIRSGDEKFFALFAAGPNASRWVATQSISSLRSTLPGESWRTLLQTFRTKNLPCRLSDEFSSARTASELCGKGGTTQSSTTASLRTDRTQASACWTAGRPAHKTDADHEAKGYNVQRDFVF